MASAPAEKQQLRFLLYSHDGQGLGHTRRNLAIAAALTELAPQAAVLLVTGIDEVHWLGVPDKVGVLKLPGLTKIANDRYEGRRLHIPQPDLWELRSSLLTTAVNSFRPDVLLSDKHPLGVNGELRPALDVLRAAGGRTALGLRDVLDDPATVLSEWARYDLHSSIGAYYDRVLVYGHQSVFNPVKEYDFPAALAARTAFCGYVIDRANRDDGLDVIPWPLGGTGLKRPVVLATPGGGEDGFALLHTFIKAAAGAPWHAIAVTGPMAREQDHLTLCRLAAEAGATVHTFINGLPKWFAAVDALVCMGGYNTLVEAVSQGVPTVCVPRVSPRTEQLIRARAFARLGLLRCIQPEELSVSRLRDEVAAIIAIGRKELLNRASAAIPFDGARRAASSLLELAEARTTTESSIQEERA